ncbi:MAG: hypothetical protein RIR62_2904 [Pseudomonadota bacterium]
MAGGDPVALRVDKARINRIARRRAIDRPDEIARHAVTRHVAGGGQDRTQRQRQDRCRRQRGLIGIRRLFRREIGVARRILKDGGGDDGGRAVGIGDEGRIDGHGIELLRGAAIDVEPVETAPVVQIVAVIRILGQVHGGQDADLAGQRAVGRPVGPEDGLRVLDRFIALRGVDPRQRTEEDHFEG